MISLEPRKVAKFLALALPEKLSLANLLWRRQLTGLFYRRFARHIGKNTVIFRPGLIRGWKFISIGDNTLIRYGSRIEAIEHGQDWQPVLTIGSNVNIEQHVHIMCHDRVTIGDNVSITGHCAIVDVTHPHLKIEDGMKSGDAIDGGRSLVEIGEGTFVGFGAKILPNVKIGKNCMIGAGSVVTKDVPDGASVAGVPARIL